MIARNEGPKFSRRVQKRQARTAAIQQAQVTAQITLNAVLWQIIRQNAEANEEDFDTTELATLTVPREEFKGVPKGFGLQVKHDKNGNVIIVASGVAKSNLILPDKKIIGGDN